MVIPLNIKIAANSFKHTRHEFYEDMAEALEVNGVALFLRKNAERFKNKPRGILANFWLQKLDDNNSVFSRAIEGTVPLGDIMILAAAEDAGKLEAGLRQLATNVMKLEKLRDQFRGVVATPVFGLAIVLVIILANHFMVIPMYLQLVPDTTEWHPSGLLMYQISQNFAAWWWLDVLISIAIIVVFVWSFENWTGAGRRVAEKYFFLYRIYANYQGAITLVGLASMMDNGKSFVDALRLIHARGSKWMQWHITQMLANLDSAPNDAGGALDTGMLMPEVAYRLKDYSEAGSFEQGLRKISSGLVDLTEIRVTQLTNRFQKLMLVVITLCFVSFYGANYMTTNQFKESIEQKINQQSK
jgi:type II secretory pathway component PulF